jgi:hypothetical protein
MKEMVFLASVPAVIPSVLAPVPATAHTAGHDRGGTGYRGGPSDRSSSEQAASANSTSTEHLRLLLS